MKTIKLNLGCGDDYKEGFINCDIANVKKDMDLDLENTLPFSYESVDYVFINHVIEHLRDYDYLIRELHKVCKEDAIIDIYVPFFSSYTMFSSPEHIHFFTPKTLDRYNKLFEIKSQINFFRRGSPIIDKIINFKQYFYCRFFAFIFPASQMHYELKKRVKKNE